MTLTVLADTHIADQPIQTDPRQRYAVLLSCHRTLVRLGDLSRYRESDFVKKGKDYNWGPAIGYYDLANAIYPVSGTPHNQLAIIAKTNGNHLSALYHLYRALCAGEPYPTARANIELELKKIQEGSGRCNTETNGQGNRTPPAASKGSFLALHALCYSGREMVIHDQIENDFLEKLAIDLKSFSLDSNAISEIAIINIAAEFAAGERFQGMQRTVNKRLSTLKLVVAGPDLSEVYQAFCSFQRINVRTLAVFLQTLRPEYARFCERAKGSTMKYSSIIRQLLPALRHYSSWMLLRASLLVAQAGDAFINEHIKNLWCIYASTLTLLRNGHPSGNAVSIDYLLEEDEETVGFKPFEDELVRRRYKIHGSSARKPRSHDQEVKQLCPNLEVVGRIQDLIQDGMSLAQNDLIPIHFDRASGSFLPGQDQKLHLSDQASNSLTAGSPDEAVESQGYLGIQNGALRDVVSAANDVASRNASTSLSSSNAVHQRMDNLVEPEIADKMEDQIPTTPVQTSSKPVANATTTTDSTYNIGNSTLTAMDFVNRIRSQSPGGQAQGSPKPLPPSSYNTPFAPKAEEEAVFARPGSAKRIAPSDSQQTSQHRLPSQQQQQQQQQQPDGPSVRSSTISSNMTDPSSVESVHRNEPRLFQGRGQATYGPIGGIAFHHPQRHGINPPSSFNSAELLDSSYFRPSSYQPTPPSGQQG